MTANEKVLSDLLNRACEIITSLEGYANEHSHYPEHNRELQKSIDDFFNEVDMLNEEDTGPEHDSAGFTDEDRIVEGQYMTYVENVKRSIDKATEEGILKNDDSEGYSYLSKEEFIKRLEVDPRFVEMGDPNWLFPGEPLHDDPDAEAQDYNTFGKNKI